MGIWESIEEQDVIQLRNKLVDIQNLNKKKLANYELTSANEKDTRA